MGQGTAETGKTEWDTWDKRDNGTVGMVALVPTWQARISAERSD